MERHTLGTRERALNRIRRVCMIIASLLRQGSNDCKSSQRADAYHRCNTSSSRASHPFRPACSRVNCTGVLTPPRQAMTPSRLTRSSACVSVTDSTTHCSNACRDASEALSHFVRSCASTFALLRAARIAALERAQPLPGKLTPSVPARAAAPSLAQRSSAPSRRPIAHGRNQSGHG